MKIGGLYRLRMTGKSASRFLWKRPDWVFEQQGDWSLKPEDLFLLVGIQDHTKDFHNGTTMWYHVMIGDRIGWIALENRNNYEDVFNLVFKEVTDEE